MKLSWLSLVFTAIIIYLAATRLDLGALWNAVQRVEPFFLFAALGTWILVVGFKSLKWRWVLHALGGTISLLESARILLIGLFVGVITPGRVGDVVRAAYVKSRVGVGRGIMAVFVDRAMDILVLLLFAGTGILELASVKGIHLISNELLVLVFVVFLTGLFLALNRRVARKGWPLIRGLIPAKFSESISKHGAEFYDSIPLLKKNILWLVLGLAATFVSWLLTITFGFFLLQGTGIPVDWNVALLAVPVLALVEILPLGVAGVGTREVAAVVVLGAYGAAAEPAIVFSLLYFAFGYIPSFILGAFFFNRHPVPIEGEFKGIFSNFLKKKETKN